MELLILVGNLGQDPEMRYTPEGKAVTNFSVACNREYTKNDGSKVKETTWYRISAWGRLAEVCNQYLRKGHKVTVQGRLNADPATGGPRIWTGQDGSARANFEVVASLVEFPNREGDGGGSSGEEIPWSNTPPETTAADKGKGWNF